MEEFVQGTMKLKGHAKSIDIFAAWQTLVSLRSAAARPAVNGPDVPPSHVCSTACRLEFWLGFVLRLSCSI